MPAIQRIKVVQKWAPIILPLNMVGLFHDFPYLTINFRLIFLIVFTTFIMPLFLFFRLFFLDPHWLWLLLLLILRFITFVDQRCLIIFLSMIIKQWGLHATAVSGTGTCHLACIVLLVVQ